MGDNFKFLIFLDFWQYCFPTFPPRWRVPRPRPKKWLWVQPERPEGQRLPSEERQVHLPPVSMRRTPEGRLHRQRHGQRRRLLVPGGRKQPQDSRWPKKKKKILVCCVSFSAIVVDMRVCVCVRMQGWRTSVWSSWEISWSWTTPTARHVTRSTSGPQRSTSPATLTCTL